MIGWVVLRFDYDRDTLGRDANGEVTQRVVVLLDSDGTPFDDIDRAHSAARMAECYNYLIAEVDLT